jgi:hypothetical protein
MNIRTRGAQAKAKNTEEKGTCKGFLRAVLRRYRTSGNRIPNAPTGLWLGIG